MIVRDETHVLGETLACIAPLIDTWVIVDTGSTDGTQEVVRAFFAERGIPGELHERPWVDFGANRSEALALCRGKGDYAWVIDADDLVVGAPDFSRLAADAYLLQYGSDFRYWRMQLFRTSRAFRYEGLVHEYPVCDDGPFTEARLGGDYRIESRRLGARNRDPDKYRRDAALLRAMLAARPDDARSVFYLGQSLVDAGETREGLAEYERRATMGGWAEEVFYAKLQAARCRERLGEPFEGVLGAYLAAWQERPSRAEALVEAARLCRLHERWNLATLFAREAAARPLPQEDVLFVGADAHEYRALDEFGTSAYYSGHLREGFDACCELLLRRNLPDRERPRIEANRDFYVPSVLETTAVYPVDTVRALTRRVRRAHRRPPQVTLTVTSCKRFELFERTINSFLNCCEDIDRIGRFICVDDNSSDEDRRRMRERYPFFEFLFKSSGEKGHARSMNLILERVTSPYWLHLEDDWHFFVRDRYVTRGLAILADDADVGQVLFNRNYAETLADRSIVGGEVRSTRKDRWRYRLHVHAPHGSAALDRLIGLLGPGEGTNAWWPHYSLRPSLVRMEAVRAVGEYDPAAEHFELDYASRWSAMGLTSAFFDLVTCLHTGTLTGERGGARRPNAYDLNDERQFGRVDRPTARVKLAGNWISSEGLCAQWARQSKGGGRWDEIEVTSDDDADYVAIVNRPFGRRQVVEPSRTVVFHMEPPHAVATWGDWSHPDARDFVQVRSHDRFLNPAEWHLGMTYQELRDGKIAKSRDLSAIVSGKTSDPGQRLRVDFLKYLEAHDVPVDVYGFDNRHAFSGYRGALPDIDKRGGIMPYRYTLAVENSCHANYATEKLWDAILGECLAFYWGCPNLETYLDPTAFIRLPLEDFATAQGVIERAIRDDEWSRRIEAIRREKRRVLDQLQIFPVLARIVRGHRFAEALDVRVVNLDRRPDRWRSFTAAAEAAAGAPFAGRCRRFPAVDGRLLALTPEIGHLFRANDFGYRRGIVGCALSHLALWRELAESGRRADLILEDDARLCPAFNGQLIELCGWLEEARPDFDLALLGHTPWQARADEDFATRPQAARVMPIEWSNYLGGLFAYLLSREGARRLLALVERDGIQNGIDWFVMRKGGELRIVTCVPHIATAALAVPHGDVDSDIQHDFTPLS